MEDLFEYYENQEPKLKVICDKWADKKAEEGLSYADCAEFQKEVEAIGYTFEYGLDAEPLGLYKISMEKTNCNTDDFLNGELQSDFTSEDRDEFNKE